jgi:hypothetical protein
MRMVLFLGWHGMRRHSNAEVTLGAEAHPRFFSFAFRSLQNDKRETRGYGTGPSGSGRQVKTSCPLDTKQSKS